jgi:hypothetical protein
VLFVSSFVYVYFERVPVYDARTRTCRFTWIFLIFISQPYGFMIVDDGFAESEDQEGVF